MEIAAGEYGYDPFYFRRMLEAGAVDVLQADATRCGGITGFLRAAALCRRASAAALGPLRRPRFICRVAAPRRGSRNIEWFHDHVRIEHMLFDGAPQPQDGCIAPGPCRGPDIGLSFKQADAERSPLDARG